jgi:uncharacterized membrane protein SpoIIM required for sporulation
MLPQLLLTALLVILTCGVHSSVTILVVRTLPRRPSVALTRTTLGRVALVVATVLLLFVAALIEPSMWATAYLQVGAMDAFERALYFSMVTFTTLGYGDITLSEDWRMMASFQAALGIIVFGWTTAILVAIVQRMVRIARGEEL